MLAHEPLFHEFNILSELSDFILKLFDSLLCDFVAIVGRIPLFQGALSETFFTIILVFYVVGNPPDSLLSEHVCRIAVFTKNLAWNLPFLVLLPEKLLE